MTKLTVGSLFSGVGGFDLGMERAGLEIIWQCDNDPFCQKVLKKHWPDVRMYNNVKEINRTNTTSPDVIVGGFPCQDISEAKRGARGLDGKRSGLWWEFRRIIGELRPRFAIVENVSNLSNQGIERVLGSLAEIGYDAEWEIIPACALGAPHARERMFIVAYPQSCHGVNIRREQGNVFEARKRSAAHAGNGGGGSGWGVGENGYWTHEPKICRVVDGVPSRMDRLRLISLGNAVVPQIAEHLGRLILAAAMA